LAKRLAKRVRLPVSAERRSQTARAGTMTSPPSGLPVARSQTQTAVATAVNATRRASTPRVYALRTHAARGTPRPCEGAGELGRRDAFSAGGDEPPAMLGSAAGGRGS